jgi:hypothetical protein
MGKSCSDRRIAWHLFAYLLILPPGPSGYQFSLHTDFVQRASCILATNKQRLGCTRPHLSAPSNESRLLVLSSAFAKFTHMLIFSPERAVLAPGRHFMFSHLAHAIPFLLCAVRRNFPRLGSAKWPRRDCPAAYRRSRIGPLQGKCEMPWMHARF